MSVTIKDYVRHLKLHSTYGWHWNTLDGVLRCLVRLKVIDSKEYAATRIYF